MADERGQIRAIVRGLNRVTSRVVAKITLDLVANLIETTPVDTGWAKANWVPRIGRTLNDPVGEPGTSDASEQLLGQARVLSYKVEEGKVFVTNNVPYIEILNEGHSPKQAAGFVQRAIRKAVTEDIRGLGL